MTPKENYWADIVAAHEESNLNATQFCRAQGLAYRSILSWRKCLSDSTCFVELIKADSIELSCGSLHLSLSVHISFVSLSRVIAALNDAEKSA